MKVRERLAPSLCVLIVLLIGGPAAAQDAAVSVNCWFNKWVDDPDDIDNPPPRPAPFSFTARPTEFIVTISKTDGKMSVDGRNGPLEETPGEYSMRYRVKKSDMTLSDVERVFVLNRLTVNAQEFLELRGSKWNIHTYICHKWKPEL